MEECETPKQTTDGMPKLSPKARNFVTKILIIVIALLVFQIPLSMIGHLAGERRDRALDVKNEIARGWGGEQRVTLLPQAEKLECSAEVTPEIRHRGIYQTVIYTSRITIDASFRNLEAAGTGTIKLSDMRGLDDGQVTVNGKTAGAVRGEKTLTFPLPAGDSECRITLELRGSSYLHFQSNAKKFRLTMSGQWDSPSFQGDVLPVKREISGGKFCAEWNCRQGNDPLSVGTDFCIPAGAYQQLERCFTYATFFLLVFFCMLLFAECFTGITIHILQYLVAAGAPVLFYLLTLAISEHTGFTVGYTVSAGFIVAMVTAYAGIFLGRVFPALVMGLLFAACYLGCFVLLRMEEFALLTGSVMLAVILFVMMLVTGRINRETEGK